MNRGCGVKWSDELGHHFPGNEPHTCTGHYPTRFGIAQTCNCTAYYIGEHRL